MIVLLVFSNDDTFNANEEGRTLVIGIEGSSQSFMVQTWHSMPDDKKIEKVLKFKTQIVPDKWYYACVSNDSTEQRFGLQIRQWRSEFDVEYVSYPNDNVGQPGGLKRAGQVWLCGEKSNNASYGKFDGFIQGVRFWDTIAYDFDAKTIPVVDGCHYSCKNCLLGPSAFDCNACQENYTMVNGKCTFCAEGNYSPDGLTCSPCSQNCQNCTGSTAADCTLCKQGFYRVPTTLDCETSCPTKSVRNEGTRICDSCHVDCGTCTNTTDTSCLTCGSAQTKLVSTAPGRCTCIDGFYQTRTNPLTCKVCPSNCKYCANAVQCTACKDRASLTSQGTCACSDGFYGTPDNCIACHESCGTCTSAGSTNCGSCADHYKPNNNLCEKVPEGEFYDPNDGTTHSCHTTCKTCLKTGCTSCKNSAHVVNGTYCAPVCSTNQFLDSVALVCRDCTGVCGSCSNTTSCDTCVSNASYVSGGSSGVSLCECDDGFVEQRRSCASEVTLGLTAGLVPSGSDEVLLTFSAALSLPLQTSDILSVTASSGVDVSINAVKELSPLLSYEMGLKFGTSRAERETITLVLSSALKSKAGATLNKPTLTTSLAYSKPTEESETSQYLQAEKDQAETANTTAKTTAKLFVSSAYTVGLVTGDLGSVWNMLNTLQILAFIPLTKTNMPLQLTETLKGFMEYGIFPDVFEYTLSEESEEDVPYKTAEEFGYETSTFMKNAGGALSQPLFLIAMFPILYGLTRIISHERYIGKRLVAMVESFRSAFWLRTITEVYLEVYAAGLIQAMYTNMETEQTAFSTVFGFSLLILLGLVPFVVFTLLALKSSAVQTGQVDPVRSGFGGYFIEFRCAGNMWALMFYPLFYLRRVLYVFNLMFIRFWIVHQCIGNVLLCLLQITFLIYFKPYLIKSVNIVSIICEVFTIAIFVLCAQFEYNESGKDGLMWLTITLIFLCVFVCQFEALTQTFLVRRYGKYDYAWNKQSDYAKDTGKVKNDEQADSDLTVMDTWNEPERSTSKHATDTPIDPPNPNIIPQTVPENPARATTLKSKTKPGRPVKIFANQQERDFYMNQVPTLLERKFVKGLAPKQNPKQRRKVL